MSELNGAETRRRRSPYVWVIVAMAGVIVILLGVISQLQGRPSATGAPSADPAASADGPAAELHSPTARTSQQQAQDAFLESLPRRQEGDPMAKGRVDAPVVLTEWADYRCPFCSVWAEDTLPELQGYIDDGTLRIEFRDLAIFGDESIKAATAARAAGVQGRFFEFQQALFAALPNQGHPDIPDELVTSIVTDLGLDVAQFERDWADPAHRESVLADSADAQQLGVTSTPAFVVGRQFLAGAQPLETFRAVIEEQAELLG